jgi:serine protease AprX
MLAAGSVALAVQGDVWRSTTNSENLQQQGGTGDGVVVALIDSGVASVPELSGTVIQQVNLSGGSSSGDQYGHGTFVAGLIHRAAPDAKIISLKLSGSDGSVDTTQVIAAMQWVATHRDQYGIDVVNLSFGSDASQSYRLSPLDFAAEQLWDMGIVVVASAGNMGSSPNTITKPGDDPLVITVGSVDDLMSSTMSDDVVADYSSRGPSVDGLPKPDVVTSGSHVVSLRAPGSTVDNQFPEGRVGTSEFRGSGTSFSAGIVSGLVSQLLEENASLSPDEVKYALMTTAHTVNGVQNDEGSGQIDVMAATFATREGASQAHVPRSTGGGTIDGDRGSNRVTIPGLLGLPTAVTGNLTSQGGLLNLLGLLSIDWTILNWNDTPWANGTWRPTSWDGGRWGGGRWGGGRWGASQWWGGRWG